MDSEVVDHAVQVSRIEDPLDDMRRLRTLFLFKSAQLRPRTWPILSILVSSYIEG